jgi:hypothetical protein
MDRCAKVPDDSRQLVAALQDGIRCLEGARRPQDPRPFSSGCPPLDRLLPGAGFPRGALIEWLSNSAGGGGEMLAMLAAREAVSQGGVLVVMDRQRQFYPPAAAALGIDLERTIVIRARRAQEEMWALDQALRCRGVAAAWAALEQLDWRWFRRLQLAVEAGGGLGLIMRPARVRGQPSWSQVQLLVQPCLSEGSRRLHVEVTRCQGKAAGGMVELEIDDVTGAVCSGRAALADSSAACARIRPVSSKGCHETHSLQLAAQLAHPTPRRRTARA